MTTAKVAPKVGDRVRVTVEGAVSYAAEGNFDIGVFATLFPARALGGALTVEVLPPPVRVGDVATREVLDRLPHRSVLIAHGHALQLFPYQGESRWHYAGDKGAYTSETVATWGATVIFIPDTQ